VSHSRGTNFKKKPAAKSKDEDSGKAEIGVVKGNGGKVLKNRPRAYFPAGVKWVCRSRKDSGPESPLGKTGEKRGGGQLLFGAPLT